MARAHRIRGKFQHGVIVVPVKLNDVRLEFMLDTGASVCSINQGSAVRLGFDLKGASTIQVVPASGSLIRVPVTKVELLEVGMASRNNLSFAVLDFPTELFIDGLLGMNFLKNFRFTIEPDTATLILREIPKS